MSEQTVNEKEYFAMKGALQAIAKSTPPMPADQAQLVARKAIDYCRHCIVCLMQAGEGQPPLCSEACAKVLRSWEQAPVFAGGGAG